MVGMGKQEAAKERNTAVIVFHGMGQQVPFQTLGDVAEKIRNLEPWSSSHPRTVAGNIPCRAPGASAGATLSRIRMTFADPENREKVRNIDFYESYWAPVTAGKVSLFDTLTFLIQGGWAGIRFSFLRRFDRYFWSSKRSFPIPYLGNLTLLFATLAIVVCLAGLMLGMGFAIQGGAWKEYLAALAFLFRALHLAAIPVLLALLFARHGLGGRTQAGIVAATLIGLLSFFLAVPPGILTGWGGKAFTGTFAAGGPPFFVLLGILVADILLGLIAWRGFFFGKTFAPDPFSRVVWLQSGLAGFILVGGVGTAGILALLRIPSGSLALGGTLLLWLYGVAGVIAMAVVRKFLIEYVGDVAAYMSTHKAGKFSEIRSRILADAFTVAGHVFASGSSGKTDDATEYSEVMFVGHSLGSVIAYDTLNGIINHDLIHKQGWNASARTKLLLTFGSPLDKTAFIFRAQVENNPCREMLASAKQPLLEERHAFRPAAWVNVWSHCDIISGPLEFYDRGTVAPEQAIGDADSYAFKYTDAAHPGQVEVQAAIQGAVGQDRRPLPVISLIDPRADIPLAAHTQFWDNDLIYTILSQALQDPGDGSGFRNFIRID